MSLRLATLNLFSGRSIADDSADPARVVEAVRSLAADVLACQEVDRDQSRSGGHDQATLVAEAAGATGYRFVPLVAGTPGSPGWRPADRRGGADHRSAAPAGPDYGIVLVSRRPVTAWHVLDLAPPPGRWPVFVPTRPPRVVWIADEPRAVVAAELADPPMVVAGTHLSFVPGVNAAQLRRARRWLGDLAGPNRPLVLLGDLNLPGRLPTLLTGWRPLAVGPTFPAPGPRVQLDHALAGRDVRAGGQIVRASGQIVRVGVGDHRAVVADLHC